MNNRIFDIMIAVTFCTFLSCVLVYVAHLIEAGHILNPNWNFAVYFLLGIACFFMVLPYILCRNLDPSHFMTTEERRILEGHCVAAKAFQSVSEQCHNLPVKPMTGMFKGEHYV